MPGTTRGFMWVTKTELRSSHLYSKHFSHSAICTLHKYLVTPIKSQTLSYMQGNITTGHNPWPLLTHNLLRKDRLGYEKS